MAVKEKELNWLSIQSKIKTTCQFGDEAAQNHPSPPEVCKSSIGETLSLSCYPSLLQSGPLQISGEGPINSVQKFMGESFTFSFTTTLLGGMEVSVE